MPEIRKREGHGEAHQRAEERHEVQDSERKANEEAVRQPDQREARTVEAALYEANHGLALEEAYEYVEERVDLRRYEAARVVLEEQELLRYLPPLRVRVVRKNTKNTRVSIEVTIPPRNFRAPVPALSAVGAYVVYRSPRFS